MFTAIDSAKPLVPRLHLSLTFVLLGLLLPAAARAQVIYTGTTANQNFGSLAIGSTSAATTFSFSVAAGTTVGSIGVVTQGAPNLDFTSATVGTCTAVTYASTTTCTVNVTFNPKFAGGRMGAVVFFSAAGNTGTVLGEVPIYGTGTGPQIAFNPSPVIAIDPVANGEGLNQPQGAVVDAAGDVFIPDYSNTRVVELPAGGGTPIVISPTVNGVGLSGAIGVALDGAGDLFIVDRNNQRVVEVPVGGGAPTAIDPTVNGEGLFNPIGLTFDGAGDLYIGDSANNRVVVVPASGGTATAISPTVNGEGLNGVQDMALDSAGDLFIADSGNNRVVEVPAGGGAATAIDPTVNGVSFSDPDTLTVDVNGDLFISDLNNKRVVEVPAGGGQPFAIVPVVNGEGVAGALVTLDGAGDLFIGDPSNNRVVELQRSQPPTVYFPTQTAVGTTDTTDGTQTVQVQNIGNETLTLTALSYPADFPEASGDANACTSSTSLSAGQECDVPVEFTPEIAGPLSESVMLTDNALNAASPEFTQQSIPVAGNGHKLNSIVIAPSSTFSTLPGGSQQFTATGSYSDGSTQDLTSLVGWSSSNTTAVTISASGLATAQTAGAAAITASLDGVTSNAVTFAVDSAAQASITASSGSGQSAYETVAFANPLVAVVKDTSGIGLQGVPVTFTAPSSGAGALFSNGMATIVANTDSTGTAIVTLAANATAGSYNVTATVDSLSANFSLTNQAWPVYSVTTLVDDAVGLGTNCTDPTIKLTSCSLRDAVTAANALPQTTATPVTTAMMPTINFASSLNLSAQSPGNYNITNGGTLTIGANMNIAGPGANLLSINGAGNQIFSINSGTVFLSGLSLVNGQGCNGGGIYNNGTLTLSNSTFSGNSSNGCGNGGGIYNNSTLTVKNSTFSGNSATGGQGEGPSGPGSGGGNGGNGSGGAISNGGALTVTNSTFSGNSATGGDGGDAEGLVNPCCLCIGGNGGDGGGGGISNGGTLTVTNSTFSGNSATGGNPGGGTNCGMGSFGNSYGGGIENGGALTVANSIFSGNSTIPGGYQAGAGIYNNSLTNADTNVYFNNQDIYASGEDDCNGCTTNTNAVSGDPKLTALGNYGGSTQTLLPLPGSAAICAGTVGDIPVGVTTDQRGFARTNSTYKGGTKCVDAGAVQTNYAMAFTTEPPPIVLKGQAISPAPVVALTESGAAATTVASSVAMTDSAALLSGTTTESFLSGAATFSNLLITSDTGSDKLIAALALNPTINLIAKSAAFQAQTTLPALTSPTPSTVLAGPSVTFTWTAGTGATQFELWLGLSGPGSSSLYSSGVTTATSATATNLPTKGATVYTRLFYEIGGVWQHLDYTYTEATSMPAALTSPTPGSTLGTSNVQFSWTAGTDVTSYELLLGITGPGSSDLYSSGVTTATSVVVPTLPVKGVTLYARLFSEMNGVFQHVDYTYTEPTAALATLTSPTPGTTLGASNVTFTWTPGSGITSYNLWLGLSGPGSSSLYVSGITTATSVTVPTIPAKGKTVYVRLFSNAEGEWESRDYTYTEP